MIRVGRVEVAAPNLSSGSLAAISWTKAVAGLDLIVEAEGARLVAVAEIRRVIGGLGVALPVEEVSDVEGSSPFTDGGEVLRGEVGEDERAVVGHVAVQSYPVANV
jgi:hypothetical protein